MRTRRRLAAALAVVLLPLGCAKVEQSMDLTRFPEKIASFTCEHGNGNCKIKVYVGIGEAGRCEIKPQYEEVRIKPGQTPKMTWIIDPVDPPHPNPYEYQFVLTTSPPLNGIKITGNTPADFDAPGYDKVGGVTDKKTFKWENRHGRSLPTQPFEYAIFVERSPRGQDTWSPCKMLDPRMVNE